MAFNSFLFAALVVLIFAATNIAAFLKRGPTNFRVFTADPNSFGLWAITLSMSGSVVGGGMFLTMGQIGYEAGKTGYVIAAAMTLGFILAALAVPRIRALFEATQVNTVIDLIDIKFSPRVATVFSLLNGLMTFFMTAGQFLGLYILCQYLGPIFTPSYLPWALAGLAVVALLLYPIIGGLRKDVLTDMVQASITLIAVVFLAFFLFQEEAAQAIAGRNFLQDVHTPGYGLAFVIGVFLFVPGAYLIRIDVWQRTRAAASLPVAKYAMLAAAAISLLACLVFTYIGIWAKEDGVEVAGRATLEIFMRKIHDPFLLSLVIAAFFAAVLTAADTYINSTALFFSRLLYGGRWQGYRQKPEEHDAHLLWRTRLLGFIAALLALILAYVSRDLVNLAVGAFSLLLMFIPVIIGLLFPKLQSERGGFYGSIIATLVFIPLFFFWNPKLAMLPGILLSILIYTGFLAKENLAQRG